MDLLSLCKNPTPLNKIEETVHILYTNDSDVLKPETYGTLAKFEKPRNYNFLQIEDVPELAAGHYLYAYTSDGYIVLVKNHYPKKIIKFKPSLTLDENESLGEIILIDTLYEIGRILNICVDENDHLLLMEQIKLYKYNLQGELISTDTGNCWNEDVHTIFNEKRVLYKADPQNLCLTWKLPGDEGWDVFTFSFDTLIGKIYTTPGEYIYVQQNEDTLVRITQCSSKAYEHKIIQLKPIKKHFPNLNFVKHLKGTEDFVCVFRSDDEAFEYNDYFVGIYNDQGYCIWEKQFSSLGIYHVLAIDKNTIHLIGNSVIYSIFCKE